MVNTLEEFESLPESLVAEFVDGRIKVFDSLTSAQHEIRNELLVKASQYLKEAGLVLHILWPLSCKAYCFCHALPRFLPSICFLKYDIFFPIVLCQ